MRSDIRKLQELVTSKMLEDDLTQQGFADLSGGILSRGMVQYLASGTASKIDMNLLPGYARALDMPVSRLLGLLGLLDVTDSERAPQVLAAATKVAVNLSGTDLEIYLDALEQIVDTWQRRIDRRY